ncbi:MAG TPA: efflux transporter outer membrane subunit [Steroidobacteraceae bacterium]|nr:efflux transporter outer membrane subunit [Steroidobacteraceae bacterium]HQR49107.1 efflux transporter outer membrane subunit [Steroidobacteraceae bacterium]
MRARTAIILVSLALPACMVGPDYHRPEVKSPDAFRFEPQQATADADAEWWKQFGDPVLDALIAEALANNWNVRIATANVEQAAGVLTTTRSPLFPQVGYSGVAARDKFSTHGTTDLASGIENPTDAYQVLAGATWEIDLWGRIRRLTEAAQADLLATQEARRGVILSLVATVATGYLQLRGLDEQLTMAERTQATYAESLRVMELKFKYGRVSQMNVEQARARYQTATAQIPRIRRDIAVLENGLSIALGRNPGPIERGKSIFDITLPQVPAGVPSDLLQRRPDVMQAEQLLVAANAQIGAAEAQFFPTISLTGALGSASTELSDLFKGPAGTWSYAGQVAGPIFSGGAIYGQVKQAKAAEQAALASYQLAIKNAFADVDNALVSRTTLAEQVAAQEKLVDALRGYQHMAQLQFDVGRAPYATVLQAEEQLFPQELAWAAARADLCASLAGIYKAMGGGWVAKAADMTESSAAAGGAAKSP